MNNEEVIAAAAASMSGDYNLLILQITILISIVLYYILQPKEGPSKEDRKLYPYMLGLATGNPKYKVTQREAVKIAQAAPGCTKLKGVLDRLYANTAISNRYMSIPDFSDEADRDPNDELLYKNNNYAIPIQQRLQRFRKEAIPLVTDVCKRAIADARVSMQDISKLIIVSSTGFLGPSLDCELIETLGLPSSTDRSLIGFMGCAAAINGYRIATDFAIAHPGKLALLVCIELSSVHSTFKDSVNDAVIHAIFGDGCAACVIVARPKSQIPKGTLCIVDNHGWLMEGTQDGIVLAINDDGISCTLSKNLPTYISKNMGAFVDGLLSKQDMKRADVDFWAIHPGGKRIIQEAQNGLGVTDDQTADSWHVLKNYGNMLSPSVMFVLQRILERNKDMIAKGMGGYKMGIAFSFSPGVGAEGIILKQVHSE